MKSVLEFKGFVGSVAFNAGDEVFFGKIIGIRDVVTFEGATIKELIKAFQDSVSDYVKICREIGKDLQESNENRIWNY